MEIWWRVRGWVRLRLTTADCSRRLREISREIRLEDIRLENALTAAFTVSRGDWDKIKVRDGDDLELVGAGGLPVHLQVLRRWRIFAGAVVLLGLLTVYLPTRIWFVQVEGNGEIPARLILERAEECGVCFGASRRELRSEQVKNHLLWAIPELRWAGVNTSGCTAVITVAVRQEENPPEPVMPGDIVAGTDAVVTEVYPLTGTVLTAPGQAVQAGQVLISGTTDLGLTIRRDRAGGEVYGLTRRSLETALPETCVNRKENGRVVRKYSLRIGKKYVNFSNDSGILYGTCVKMRTVKYLTLPGGFTLPVALVTETYRLCETETAPRPDGAELMTDAGRRYVLEQMTAGAIRSEEWTVEDGRVMGEFACREMIGIFRPGTITEGDTNDRENRERGAG
mgnify:CR=1 FL=1